MLPWQPVTKASGQATEVEYFGEHDGGEKVEVTKGRKGQNVAYMYGNKGYQGNKDRIR